MCHILTRLNIRPLCSIQYHLLNYTDSTNNSFKAHNIITGLQDKIYSIKFKKYFLPYNNNLHLLGSIRLLVSDKKENKMVDPRRVVSYEDVLKVIHQPEKVLIDVRNPDEVNTTGKIPSSINIPLNSVQEVLVSMSNEEFKKQYQRNKPSSTDELIFYCHSGRRSTEALDIALKLGYSKSKTYLGSWNEWSRTQK